MKLRIHIKRLDDGRFMIAYCWHLLEATHREYVNSPEELSSFISSLVDRTEWKK